MAMALEDVNKNPGSEKVYVVMGRFQPLTTAHTQIIENAYEDDRKVIVAVVKSNNVKSPYPFELVKEIIENSVSVPLEVIELKTGFIGDFISPLRDKGLEPVALFAGTDRLKGYEVQVKRYQEMFNLALIVKEIPRVESDVSASKVRDALTENNEELFKSMTPSGAHIYYERLKEYNEKF
jgi:citrate lyase synthetase